MSRPFNPQIRKLTRLVLEIPPEAPLPDCSWPKRSEECSLGKGNLIDSRVSTRKDQYEVRSINERNECAIGPEILSALKNPQNLKKVSEMLADIEIQAGNVPLERREFFMKELKTLVDKDIQTRSQTLIYYFIYLIISFFLLGYHNMQTPVKSPLPIVGNQAVFTLINIVPLVAIYYLHNMFLDRVRTGTYFHIIPLALLVSYALYARILQEGSVNTTIKYLTILSVIIAIMGSIYLLFSFQGIYSDCYRSQTNTSTLSLTPLYLGVAGGLILPLILIMSTYLAL
jgi:hypothetical protein